MKRNLIFILCMIMLLVPLGFYAYSFVHPYMDQNRVDISNNWTYYTDEDSAIKNMPVLKRVRGIQVNEVLYLNRVITEEIPDGALLVTSNFQRIRLLLDDKLFFQNYQDNQDKIGMGLYYILLPRDYTGKKLTMEISALYENYTGSPARVFLGDIPSLEAYAISDSMPHFIQMVISILLGLSVFIMSFFYSKRSGINIEVLMFGVFSILWGGYCLSYDYIIYQFFSPSMVYYINMLLYFTYPLPLISFFYYHIHTYKKFARPAVWFFAICTFLFILLDRLGIAALPEMMNHTSGMVVVIYTYFILLGFLELRKGNRFFKLTWLWLVITFVIPIQDMVKFYTLRVTKDTPYQLLIFILIILIFSYYFMELLKSIVKERNQMKFLQYKNQMTLEGYQNTKKYLDRMSILNHDMNGHFMSMQILLEEKQYDKLSQYLSGLVNQKREIKNVYFCDHYIINSILSTRVLEMEEKGILITHEVIVPQKLQMEDTDLCAVLENILDNAEEALDYLGRDRTRWMKLKMNVQEPYLYIECSNAKKNDIRISNGMYISSKVDKENHGYGLKSIEEITKKYEGFMDILHDEEHFSLTVALKIC